MIPSDNNQIFWVNIQIALNAIMRKETWKKCWHPDRPLHLSKEIEMDCCKQESFFQIMNMIDPRMKILQRLWDENRKYLDIAWEQKIRMHLISTLEAIPKTSRGKIRIIGDYCSARVSKSNTEGARNLRQLAGPNSNWS